jgi:hypothetical protein
MLTRTCRRCGIGRRLRASAQQTQSPPTSDVRRQQRKKGASSGLVDPYSPEWHGFHRGPKFVPVLPEEISISILTEAVPFHQDTLLVTQLSTSPDVRLELTRSEDSLQKHMQMHFRTVSTKSMQPRNRGGGATDPRSAAQGLVVASAQPALPKLKSPTEELPSHSLDVVCLAPSVFSEILQQNPYFLTSFHQVLRPHGIIAITGLQRLRIVSPSWIAGEYHDLIAHLRQTCKASCDIHQQRGDRHEGDEWADSLSSRESELTWNEMERRRESVEAEHRDIYLPFPNIKRRTFTTQYQLTVDELVGSVRALPECEQALGASTCGQRLSKDPIGVVRDRSSGSFSAAANPLEVFDGLLSARLGAAAHEPCVVAEVDSFVITCNWRRANHIPGSDSSRQLESAGRSGQLTS